MKNTGLTALGQQKSQLTGGLFVGAKGLFVRIALIDFDSFAGWFNPVTYSTGSELGQCWPCGEGERICAAGSHVDVAAQFCSERKPDTKIVVRTRLTGADEHARLAVGIVEKTIDIYEKTAKDVGGAVDAVTITKDGTITWNFRKNNCPENQDYNRLASWTLIRFALPTFPTPPLDIPSWVARFSRPLYLSPPTV